jgi:hypothetical protein
MPRFLTIGYGDADGYERTDADLRARAHAHDALLRSGGAEIAMAGEPVQVRNPDGSGVQTHEGPYLRSDLPVAGFAVIEADDLQAAIRLVAETPCAIASGVVEVWPMIVADSTP